MATDREVLRIVWDGQIPAVIQGDPDEMEIQQPEDFYLMIPRLSYLPLVSDKVKKYFQKYIADQNPDSGNIWFDYNGTPLKLHYPIGVLYDLTHREDEGLPWRLTIHFTKFPEDVLVKFSTKDILESHFLSCLKEADVLKHRGQIISAMTKKDHNQLWLGLVNDKFDQFWAVNRRLMESCNGNGSEECFKHIPVRLYNEDGTFTQKLISPINEAGQKRALHEMLTEISSVDRQAVAVRTHGVFVHEETPIQWMSEHLSYPDNFLHLHIIYKEV